MRPVLALVLLALAFFWPRDADAQTYTCSGTPCMSQSQAVAACEATKSQITHASAPRQCLKVGPNAQGQGAVYLQIYLPYSWQGPGSYCVGCPSVWYFHGGPEAPDCTSSTGQQRNFQTTNPDVGTHVCNSLDQCRFDVEFSSSTGDGFWLVVATGTGGSCETGEEGSTDGDPFENPGERICYDTGICVNPDGSQEYCVFNPNGSVAACVPATDRDGDGRNDYDRKPPEGDDGEPPQEGDSAQLEAIRAAIDRHRVEAVTEAQRSTRAGESTNRAVVAGTASIVSAINAQTSTLASRLDNLGGDGDDNGPEEPSRPCAAADCGASAQGGDPHPGTDTVIEFGTEAPVLSESRFGLRSRSCPIPTESMTVMMGPVELAFPGDLICNWLEVLAAVILLAAYATAGWIVARI